MNPIHALHSLHSLLQYLYSAAERRSTFDGVDVRRMGDLAREHGTTRWKQAPAGTGRNVSLVALSLSSNAIGLYGHSGNASDHGNGGLMTKAVMGQLHADDYVITLDLTCQLAKAIADGTAGVTVETVPDEYLALYKGDRIRAANLADVMHVSKQIIVARMSEPKAA